MEAAYKGTQIQHILSNMCMRTVKIQYYQSKLLNKFQISITNVLHLIFFLPMPINIDISYCHQHSKGDIPLSSAGSYATLNCCTITNLSSNIFYFNKYNNAGDSGPLRGFRLDDRC